VAEYAWLDKSMDTSEKITVLDCSNALAFLIQSQKTSASICWILKFRHP
jgi:hypothetical protein